MKFFGPQNNPHVVSGLSKHYHVCFYPKLGHVPCEIHSIPFTCTQLTSTLDKPWNTGVSQHHQPRYQPVKYCTYWIVLGSFNNWKIIQFSYKSTPGEYLNKIQQVKHDRISYNMDALVQTLQYGDINTTDTTTMGYYVIKFFSESYTVQ